MEVLLFLAVLPLAALLAVVLYIRPDGDLTLLWADKFGEGLGKIKGRVVWITGASTGIGAALAVVAARHGARLVLSARSEDLLNETKKKCVEAAGGRRAEEEVLVLPLDVARFEDHAPALAKVLEHFGKVDVMVHNAGRSQRANWADIDLQVDRDMFDLNVFGPVNLSRLLCRHFADKGNLGHFVVMSSVAGIFGVPFSGSYTGSKHAINGYFEGLRTEKAGSGIDVTILCPGPVFSNILQAAATEKAGEALGKSMNPADKRMATERCAHLSLVAIVNRLQVAWMAPFAVLLLVYLNQYCPTYCKRFTAFLGPAYFKNARDSLDDVHEKQA